MLMMKDSYYINIEKYLKQYLFQTFYLPMLAIIREQSGIDIKLNAISNIVSSLKSGKITYDNGEFKGAFNIGVSKALNKFADFDDRSKSWKVKNVSLIPANINAAIVEVSAKNESVDKELNSLFDNLEDRFNDDIDPELKTPIEKTIDQMQDQMQDDVKGLGIQLTMTPDQRQAIVDDYNINQDLNIKDWNFDQVQRLRDTILKIRETGYNKINLKQLIEREWDVSSNKAKFLARQETSLFLSKFRREQSKHAGIRKYKWSTSGDERVRPEDGSKFTPGNNHKRLHGKVFSYGDPPIVDTKTGRRAEPGEDFNCRCVAIPVAGE